MKSVISLHLLIAIRLLVTWIQILSYELVQWPFAVLVHGNISCQVQDWFLAHQLDIGWKCSAHSTLIHAGKECLSLITDPSGQLSSDTIGL